MVLKYNILNGFVVVGTDKILDVYRNICRGPTQKIRKILCRTNSHLNYFGIRVYTDRYLIPTNITFRKSIVGFRYALKRSR